MNIFGDAIDDMIFPKKNKRFTQEEKSLIDKFINTILREDKKSNLQDSRADSFNNRIDKMTEKITKIFIFRGVLFHLYFSKFFSDDININGPINFDGHYDLDFMLQDKLLQEDLAKEGSLTGITVRGDVYKPDWTYLDFILKSRFSDATKACMDDGGLGLRTRYEGSNLTTTCKNRIEKYHLKIIKDAILKVTKLKKKKK